MIKIELLTNSEGILYGVRSKGHAGFAESGSDIVCAAVSMLLGNTVNSIDRLTDEPYTCDTGRGEGYLYLEVPALKKASASKSEKKSKSEADARLLLASCEIGVMDLMEEYPDFIDVKIKAAN